MSAATVSLVGGKAKRAHDLSIDRRYGGHGAKGAFAHPTRSSLSERSQGQPHGLARAPQRRCRRHRAAPAIAVRFRRPAAGAQEPVDLHRGGAQARRGAGSRAVRWAARSWQDHTGADRGEGGSASAFAPPRVPSSPRPAISQRSSPISKSATCSSSTKFTASARRSKKCSIPRWRIFSSTSSSARAPRRAR